MGDNAKSSKVRWLILSMLCMMYLITYMDRTNISVAAPLIGKEFGFDKVTLGVIFSVFSWAYAIGQVPGGWLGDRFGPRGVLSTIVAYWSFMTIVTGQAVSYLSFLIVRFLFGLGEAGAFPTATRAAQLWYAKSERGFVQGITHSCSRLGAAIVPPLSVAVMTAWGWRAVFYSFGIVGIIWALLFFLVYRNIPEDHKWVNKAELARIRGLDEQGNVLEPIKIGKKPTVPWKSLITSPNMWFIMTAHFCYSYCMYFFLSWFPTYLIEYHHFSMAKMGWIASLPLFAGVIGGTVGGVISDKILKRTGNLNFSRKVVAAPGMVMASICLIPAAITTEPFAAVYWLAGSMFFLECVVGPAWALPMDVGGEYSGTVAGMMNTAGNIGSSISPIIFAAFAQAGLWSNAFFVQAGLLLVGSLVWAFWLKPETSVVVKNKSNEVVA